MAVRSCCSLSLKKGTTIIAGLFLVGLLYDIIQTYRYIKFLNENHEFLEMIHVSGLIKLLISKEFAIFAIITSVIHIVLLVMLLIGAQNEKAHFILPFFYYTVIMLLIFIVGTVCSLIYAFENGMTGPRNIAPLLMNLLRIPLTIYFCLVVYSLYQELRKSEQAGREVNPSRGGISRGPPNNNSFI